MLLCLGMILLLFLILEICLNMFLIKFFKIEIIIVNKMISSMIGIELN